MDAELITDTPATPRPGFQVGHKRFGGRPRGAKNVRTATAREIAARLKCDPAQWLLNAGRLGYIKNPDGTTTKITAADRIQAMKNVLPFVHVKRTALSVNGRIESETRSQHVDLTKIMENPMLAEYAERIVLALAQPESVDLPAAVPEVSTE